MKGGNKPTKTRLEIPHTEAVFLISQTKKSEFDEPDGVSVC